MRAILIDDKGFKRNINLKNFIPQVFIAVQVENVVNNFMYSDEEMSHFYKPNFYKVGFRFQRKSPKGTLFYKQYESIYNQKP